MDVLNRRHLSIHSLDWPEARISRTMMGELLMDFSHHTGRSDLGFEMGQQTDVLRHPLLGRLLSAASTLGDGLRRLAPYMPLVTPSFRMQCEPFNGGMNISWRPTRPIPYNIVCLALETVLVSAHRTSHQLLAGKQLSMHVRASWAPPPHAARYVELKDMTVDFLAGQGEIGVWIYLSDSTCRLPLPKPQAQLWAETHLACAQQIERLEAMSGWRDWIAQILEAVEDHQPNQAELAALMDTSVRSFARHLKSEGFSFRALAREIRHFRAQRLLSLPDASISDIARILGYTDSANFSRAFKVIEGLPPQHYRAQKQKTV
ncbi:helix-turn-helix domain-containing protein [Aquabacterium sp.]|uniref:helix-turn-helix domain-containing protein n=1 Tax=Aquabacterium sp. TaxID=1872578 RepID=UPI0035B0F367